jgi:hypothetical protein
MKSNVSVITLGVTDLSRAKQFYASPRVKSLTSS